MKNLFLIDGSPGSGKSEFITHVTTFRQSTVFVKKFSTRTKRDYEISKGWQFDLMLLSDEKFDSLDMDHIYLHGGKKYGLVNSHISDVLRTHDNVFVIIRSAEIIHTISEEYSHINVIPVYVYSDYNEVEERLRKQHYTESQIESRLSRYMIAYEDYQRHSTLYTEVIVNNSSLKEFYLLIDRMLDKYQL